LIREKLEQLSEEELETLYQQKKAEYDKKLGMNRRIRGMLSRKVDEKQKRIENLKNQISEVLKANPDFKLKYDSLTGKLKQEFDDIDQNPEEMKSLIQEKQKILSQLQSRKFHIERTLAETSKHIEQQKALETQFQTEITLLISQSQSHSNDDEKNELFELNKLSQEIKSTQDDLKVLLQEIENVRGKIHQQG
jgi:regulator of replication initiation timing